MGEKEDSRRGESMGEKKKEGKRRKRVSQLLRENYMFLPPA